MDRSNPIFYNNRSQAYFYLEQFDNALQDCDQAILLNPTYFKAISNKLGILLEMGLVDVF